MKNTMLAALILFSAAFLLSFDKISLNSQDETQSGSHFKMPDDVKQIVDNSCVGCHSSDSRNLKAKLKLKFDELGDLDVAKLAGKLSKIHKELEKEKMPPKKFVENYPDKAPTADQRKLLMNWAGSTADSLAN